MDDSPEGSPPRPADPLADLPVRATDLVESLVSLLRDRTVRPLTLAARAVVFGIIVFAASVVVLTLVAIAVVRLLTVYAFDGRVWLSDLVVGALFVLAGAAAWSQRSSRRADRKA
ncbi:MAG TPA: hypothetical protein VKW77_07185 [Acidimicrobiales bacterium]|nr:hypothetical protein [Acidimicrobiales bacterium]